MSFKIAQCTSAAATYACKVWHYSGVMPAGIIARYGVWEDEQFIGCILYSVGANKNQHKSQGVERWQCCELVRVALTAHKAPVTQMVAVTLRLLKKRYPQLLVVVSYADTAQGHEGVIYKAGNWEYLGASAKGQDRIVVNGVSMHKRSAYSRYGTSGKMSMKDKHNIDVHYGKAQPKHKYVYRFKCATSKDGVAPANQAGEGGSIPTVALNG